MRKSYLPEGFEITPEMEAGFKKDCPRKKGGWRHEQETVAMREAYARGWTEALEQYKAAIMEEVSALAALNTSWWATQSKEEQQQYLEGFRKGFRLEPLEFKPNPLPFVDGHEAGWPAWMRR